MNTNLCIRTGNTVIEKSIIRTTVSASLQECPTIQQCASVSLLSLQGCIASVSATGCSALLTNFAYSS